MYASIVDWLKRRLMVVAVVLMAAVLVFDFTLLLQYRAEREAAHNKLAVTAVKDRMSSIHHRIKDTLRAISGFYLSSNEVSEEEFDLFVSRLDIGHARALGWRADGSSSIFYPPTSTGDEANATKVRIRDVANSAISSVPLFGAGSDVFFIAPLHELNAGEKADRLIYGLWIDDNRRRGLVYMVVSPSDIVAAIERDNPLHVEFWSLETRSGILPLTISDATSQEKSAAHELRAVDIDTEFAESVLHLAIYDEEVATLATNRELLLSQVPIAAGLIMLLAAASVFGRQMRLFSQAASEAADASEQKSRFLATMSHEMRTPLNGILGMADLIERDPLTQQQSKQIGALTRSAETLLSLINQVLDFSKVEAGAMELAPVKADLKDLLSEVATAASVQAAAKNLRIVVSLPLTVPRKIVVDDLKLRQILTNLVANAIKFTNEGSVEIRVKSVEADEGALLTFDVSDTGIGISDEAKARIFEEFLQADNSTTRNFGGTGLGLSITRRFVELMGGTISVESEIGVGSRFSFTVPVEAEGDVKISRRVAALIASLRILIQVGNTPLGSALLRDCQSAGAAIESLHDGETLEEYLQDADFGDDPIDLIVTDDADSAREIRRTLEQVTQKFGWAPKIACVSDPRRDRSSEDEAELEGVSFLIDAPFTAESLLSDISQAFWHRSISRRTAEPEEAAEARKAAAAPHFAGRRVLLVEDDEVNQMYAESLLEELGFEIAKAANGQEAIDCVTADEFDIILLDCQMPVMDGFTAATEMRRLVARGSIKKTPVIALTANALRGDRERCIEAGMDDYLTKPLRRQQFVDRLLNWVSPSPAREDANADANAASPPRARPEPAASEPETRPVEAPAIASAQAEPASAPAPAPRRQAPEPAAEPAAREAAPEPAAAEAPAAAKPMLQFSQDDRLRIDAGQRKILPARDAAAREDLPPVVDVETLKETRSNLGDRFEKLLKLFIKQGGERFGEMMASLEANELSQVMRSAHTLKSSARMVGAARLSALAADLEAFTKSPEAEEDAESLRAMIKRCEAEFGAYVDVIRQNSRRKKVA